MYASETNRGRQRESTGAAARSATGEVRYEPGPESRIRTYVHAGRHAVESCRTMAWSSRRWTVQGEDLAIERTGQRVHRNAGSTGPSRSPAPAAVGVDSRRTDRDARGLTKIASTPSAADPTGSTSVRARSHSRWSMRSRNSASSSTNRRLGLAAAGQVPDAADEPSTTVHTPMNPATIALENHAGSGDDEPDRHRSGLPVISDSPVR